MWKEQFHIKRENVTEFLEWISADLEDWLNTEHDDWGPKRRQEIISGWRHELDVKLPEQKIGMILRECWVEFSPSANGVDVMFGLASPDALDDFEALVDATAQRWPEVAEQIRWRGPDTEEKIHRLAAPFDVLDAAIRTHLPNCGPNPKLISSQVEFDKLGIWSTYFEREVVMPGLVFYRLFLKADNSEYYRTLRWNYSPLPKRLEMGIVKLRMVYEGLTEYDPSELPSFQQEIQKFVTESRPETLSEARDREFMNEQARWIRAANKLRLITVEDLYDRLRQEYRDEELRAQDKSEQLVPRQVHTGKKKKPGRPQLTESEIQTRREKVEEIQRDSIEKSISEKQACELKGIIYETFRDWKRKYC